MAMPSLINGERAVVLTFLACVLRSLPASLLIHGVFLAVLAISALGAEILVEASSPASFPSRTRPLASSGVLLGAVTLPSLILCRMLQHSRIALHNTTAIEELRYHGVLYWTTYGCTALLLIFISCIALRSSKQCHVLSKIKASSFIGFICVSMLLTYQGLHTAIPFIWVLFHGASSLLLLRHILITFPSCASLGEAILVTLGIVLYFGDMLAYSFSKIPSVTVSFLYSRPRNEISVIIQGVLFVLLIFPLIHKTLLPLSDWVSSTFKATSNKSLQKSRALLFFFSLLILIALIIPYWMQKVHDFNTHPFLWVGVFVFSQPTKRLSLCIYWIAIIIISVTQFYHISKHSKTERILLRKYYHLLAVLMFLPALIFQAEFLNLAFGLALAAFLVLEIIRVFRIWPLGENIHQFMICFTDHRDSETLIVSHFSLLLGCALPMWLSAGVNDRPLSPFAGILSLGIGDAMASIIGHKYGALRWSKSGKKTIEGTAAGVTSVLIVCGILVPAVASSEFFLKNWISLLVAVVLSGLLEAYTSQLDNAFIPLIFFSLLCL